MAESHWIINDSKVMESESMRPIHDIILESIWTQMVRLYRLERIPDIKGPYGLGPGKVHATKKKCRKTKNPRPTYF